jgi:hypothetical protein
MSVVISKLYTCVSSLQLFGHMQDMIHWQVSSCSQESHCWLMACAVSCMYITKILQDDLIQQTFLGLAAVRGVWRVSVPTFWEPSLFLSPGKLNITGDVTPHLNILVTGYQAQINMKSRSRFKVISIQSHLSCFLYKVVHVSWCSVQYLVTDEFSAVALSWCYVLPLHIIQVYPAVCVSCVLWHHLNTPSALSDICFATFTCNPIHTQGMPIWSVLGRPQQLSCFSFLDINCTDAEVYQGWPRSEGPWNISDSMSVQPSVCQTEQKEYWGEMHRICEKWLD